MVVQPFPSGVHTVYSSAALLTAEIVDKLAQDDLSQYRREPGITFVIAAILRQMQDRVLPTAGMACLHDSQELNTELQLGDLTWVSLLTCLINTDGAVPDQVGASLQVAVPRSRPGVDTPGSVGRMWQPPICIMVYLLASHPRSLLYPHSCLPDAGALGYGGDATRAVHRLAASVKELAGDDVVWFWVFQIIQHVGGPGKPGKPIVLCPPLTKGDGVCHLHAWSFSYVRKQVVAHIISEGFAATTHTGYQAAVRDFPACFAPDITTVVRRRPLAPASEAGTEAGGGPNLQSAAAGAGPAPPGGAPPVSDAPVPSPLPAPAVPATDGDGGSANRLPPGLQPSGTGGDGPPGGGGRLGCPPARPGTSANVGAPNAQGADGVELGVPGGDTTVDVPGLGSAGGGGAGPLPSSEPDTRGGKELSVQQGAVPSDANNPGGVPPEGNTGHLGSAGDGPASVGPGGRGSSGQAPSGSEEAEESEHDVSSDEAAGDDDWSPAEPDRGPWGPRRKSGQPLPDAQASATVRRKRTLPDADAAGPSKRPVRKSPPRASSTLLPAAGPGGSAPDVMDLQASLEASMQLHSEITETATTAFDDATNLCSRMKDVVLAASNDATRIARYGEEAEEATRAAVAAGEDASGFVRQVERALAADDGDALEKIVESATTVVADARHYTAVVEGLLSNAQAALARVRSACQDTVGGFYQCARYAHVVTSQGQLSRNAYPKGQQGWEDIEAFLKHLPSHTALAFKLRTLSSGAALCMREQRLKVNSCATDMLAMTTLFNTWKDTIQASVAECEPVLGAIIARHEQSVSATKRACTNFDTVCHKAGVDSGMAVVNPEDSLGPLPSGSRSSDLSAGGAGSGARCGGLAGAPSTGEGAEPGDGSGTGAVPVAGQDAGQAGDGGEAGAVASGGVNAVLYSEGGDGGHQEGVDSPLQAGAGTTLYTLYISLQSVTYSVVCGRHRGGRDLGYPVDGSVCLSMRPLMLPGRPVHNPYC